MDQTDYFAGYEDKETIKAVCNRCGGNNILQQANIMLPINDFKGELKTRDELLEDMMWDDYYYCKDCSDECNPIFDGGCGMEVKE